MYGLAFLFNLFNIQCVNHVLNSSGPAKEEARQKAKSPVTVYMIVGNLKTCLKLMSLRHYLLS